MGILQLFYYCDQILVKQLNIFSRVFDSYSSK